MRKIYVKLIGGLGNQLFQYAAAQMISDSVGGHILYDVGFYSQKHSNTTPRTYELCKFPTIDHEKSCEKSDFIELNDSNYNWLNYQEVFSKLNANNKNAYLSGYFQSYSLTKSLSIDKFFSPNKGVVCPARNACVHIRRGDYVSNKGTNSYHGVLPVNYYQKAIDLITNEIDSVCVFSDDMGWCKQNLSFKKEIIFNESSSNADDLIKMSQFKHLVIANSSFSWWAARFAELKGLNPAVIAPGPSLWYNNDTSKAQSLYPSNWLKIER